MSNRKLPTPRTVGFETGNYAFQHGADQSNGIPSALSGIGGRAVWAGNTRMDQPVLSSWIENAPAGPVSGRGQRAPGTWRTHGSDVRTIGGRGTHGQPQFDQVVPPNGYLWWYIDAMSDDGQHGMTLIAFVGSVFSPYYTWARRSGQADPENHCALNVAIYSKGASRWAMTERGRNSCSRDKNEFVIGPSYITWDGDSLHIQINEISTPWLKNIQGEIRVWPEQLFNFSVPIDQQGSHRWGPLAPSARVEVNLTEPNLSWKGQAYLDSNEGDEPITEAFHVWNWSRAKMKDNSSLVFYDMAWPGQEDKLLSLRFTPQGQVEPLPAAPIQTMHKTAWQIGRRMRSDGPVELHEQLEDTPFYQRALLKFSYAGEKLLAFHETLSVPRLLSPVVQAMLPFRMPRRA